MSDGQTAQGQFNLVRVFTKDASLEVPDSPKSIPGLFSEKWEPEMEVELNTNANRVDGDKFEVALTITVTVKNEGQVAFLVEVKQGGLFVAAGIEGEQLRQLLGIYCPNILFPYARETISSLVGKAGFPQLLLSPVNFEALYFDAQEREKADKADGETAAV